MPGTTKIPQGTVTFLFTDIEGSTRLWERYPRAMQAAIARHDTLLREAIEQNGGYVFKTVGDAFCAAFPTAPQALDAALAAQRALNSADWQATGQIKARMALHTGVGEVRDNDYFGLPLNRVARLLSTGHGGQVLLSLATQQLVRDHLPPDASLKDLGEGGLKDLVKSEHVYQVVAPDLPSDFPPLKSLDAQYIEPDAGETGVELHNPYKGLRAFQEADAADFFGREALTERLLERLAEPGKLSRFLAVVGPSGSGKSSVVRAGLIPALRQGKLPGSDRWLIVEMIPGAHPFEELDAVLLSIAAKPPATLMDLLREDERGLIRAVNRVLPRDESIELALVVDQFEEVFTLVQDEPTRVHFLESLYAAVSDPRSRLRLVITLRADFFDRPLLYPDPGELMRQRTAVVLPLAAGELERAIVEPARRAEVSLEPELIAAIVKDVGEQPGALPLLQYAMTELFERRTGRTMTLEAYKATGGVLGALARRADEIYDGLIEQEREAARQLFLRLITLGEGIEDTRRRVRMGELASLTSVEASEAEAEAPTPHPSPSKPALDIPHSAFRIPHSLDRAIDQYGRYRLLTFDMDPVTKGPTVEVAHEALIRTWGRLKGWLEESRADLRVQRQLMSEAAEWARSGSERSYLSTGARLAQFEALAERADKSGGVALTTEEREYLRASVEERDRQEALEKERQERELELQKRAARGLRVLVAGLVVFLLVASGLAAWAFGQQAEANTQRQRAEFNARQSQENASVAQANENRAQSSAATAEANFKRSEAQRIAAEANKLIRARGNVEMTALLSIRSLNTEYTPQGDEALAGAAILDYPLQLFAGHTDTVTDVAFSPDGKYVATASYDKAARLWDVSTGKEVRSFVGHTDIVRGLAFSHDGKYVLTAGADKTARLWDVLTGKEVRRFDGHTDPIVSVAYSSDGRYILTGSRDTTARLWDAATGQQLRVFSGHTQPIARNGVAFSPDGQYVATASWDKTARLWNTQTGEELHILTGHTDLAKSMAFSPDGKWLLTTSNDKTVRLWDVATGEELRRFAGEVGFTDATFSPDGKYVIAGALNSVVQLWDVQSGAEVRRYIGHKGGITSIAFSQDGRYFVAGADDKLARLWEVFATPAAPQFTGHTAEIRGVAYSPDGKYVLTGSADKTLRLWDAATGREVRSFAGHTDPVWSVAFSPDGKWALSGSSDKIARLWDVATGQELRRFVGHTEPLYSVAFSPDGKQALTGSRDMTVRLWDVETGQEIRTLSMSSTFALPFVAAVYSPDGRYIFTNAPDETGQFDTARLWDAQSGKELRTFSGHSLLISAVAFSPDGKYVLTGSDDGTARLWDVTSGQEVRTFVGHTEGVYSVAFSPDGRYVLTGSDDGTARLWDATTGREVRRFVGHTNWVEAVAYSPDGKWVLTGSYDGTARLWHADYHDAVSYLCGKLLRDFTDEERAQYEIKDNEPTCPKR